MCCEMIKRVAHRTEEHVVASTRGWCWGKGQTKAHMARRKCTTGTTVTLPDQGPSMQRCPGGSGGADRGD